MRDYFKKIKYDTAVNPPHEDLNMPNVWLGVSVEDQKTADERIPILLQVQDAVRVVSYEPAIGGLDMSKWLWEPNPDYQPPRFLDEGETYTEPHEIRSNKINWVICGGETGPGARPMNPQWARDVRDQCVEAGVPFFFKSWGEFSPEYDGKSKYVNVHSGISMDEPTPMYPVGKKQAGRLLDGKEYNERPEV